MIRGTRVIQGTEAEVFIDTRDVICDVMRWAGYKEIILPSLWEQQTFIEKAGGKILNQMYTFKDKKGRDICLIPEVTAIVQELRSQNKIQNDKIFYVQRCYRYERPQKGRYREFTQIGVEDFSGKTTTGDMIVLLNKCLLEIGLMSYSINDGVKRGLDYYIEDGFEAECELLGAQEQIAGGGRYDGGIGFAIGLDRLVLALEIENN